MKPFQRYLWFFALFIVAANGWHAFKLKLAGHSGLGLVSVPFLLVTLAFAAVWLALIYFLFKRKLKREQAEKLGQKS
ncbi:MAG: hypothetical protein HY302_02865 [Opitutae bacterium]|nr:hypothetical protein [Opitutae bacterium]